MLKPLLYIFLLLLTWPAAAQMPDLRAHPAKDAGNVHFSTVMQDSRGWLWCGTQQGSLYRYDGSTFHPVGMPDSLSAGAVTALFESDGRLWVGFEQGAIAFLPIDGNFQSAQTGNTEQEKKYAPTLQIWQPEEGLPKVAITAFAEDKMGGRWFSTYGEGVYVWKNNRLYQFDQADDGLLGNEIYTLASDGEGRIWAATDAGISLCAMPEQGKKQVQNLTTADGLPDEIITALLADPQGGMWIGTHDYGICRYDPVTRHCLVKSQNWSFGAVTKMALFGHRELWAGTEKNGLIQVDAATGELQTFPANDPLRQANMHALCQDREGLLWIIGDKGVLYSANVRFGRLETPFANTQAVCTDHQDRLWAGCQDGLFLRENGVFKKIFAQKENVITLWESPADGVMWVGTFGNGLYLISMAGQVITHLTEKNGLANGTILSIGGNSAGVWLATLGGVLVSTNRFPLSGDSFRKQPELDRNNVYKVFADHRGRMWFGTQGTGLSMLENGRIQHFTEANGIPLKTIYNITEDHRGRIWFSTDRDGLFCLDSTVFQQFTLENHLHSLNMTGLAVDGNDQVVIAYDDGFDLFNPDRTDHFTFCGPAIGAPAAEVNLNALCTDLQGNVWLGTQQGIVRSIAFKQPFLDDPQPALTSVSVFLEPIDFLQRHSFAHSENYFIFNFTGLWYTDPEAVRYRYRLEGFDPIWKLTKDRLASYPNLPPGHYRFRLQTSEHGNFVNVPEVSWEFTIEPPFWLRWWFLLLCVAGIAGLVLYIVRSREVRLRREALGKREMLESQFAALKSQINPHFLFNSFNTLIATIEENPQVAVEYVEHLSNFYRSIIAYRERDFISLQEEMDLVRSFDFLLKKRYEQGYHLEDRLQGETGLVMPLALQMLVENAVKHNVISVSRPLLIEIFVENGNYLVVRNNIQKKIKAEPSTHFGLQSLIHRYQLSGERPVIVEATETHFTVKVPIRAIVHK